MAIVIALVVIVVASVLFHLLSPWWLTPLASNWREMDDTMLITLAVTGVFFVVLNFFLAYTLLRFRHRPGPDGGSAHKAAYHPENNRLERWLLIATSIGIVGLLAPGLFVYADYVHPPKEAVTVEVLGQQWQWRFRFPGKDGKLGKSSVDLTTPANPLGVDPKDPNGADDIVINNNELHLPLGKPIRMLLRSNDVLHDFFVPPFRSRMNIVPGMVSSFWFTPTKAGRYEAMCAQLCGLGHANMRGYVVVEDEAAFKQWLDKQPTFASTMAPPSTESATVVATAQPGAAGVDQLVAGGRALSQSKGCVACHTVDGSSGVGPTWKGLYGKTETMADGTTALVDDAYVKNFVRNPTARVVKGFAPIMPKIEMSDAELSALVAYIQSVGQPPPKAQ